MFQMTSNKLSFSSAVFGPKPPRWTASGCKEGSRDNSSVQATDTCLQMHEEEYKQHVAGVYHQLAAGNELRNDADQATTAANTRPRKTMRQRTMIGLCMRNSRALGSLVPTMQTSNVAMAPAAVT